MPGPLVDDADDQPPAGLAASGPGPAGRRRGGPPFSSRLAKARSSWAGSATERRQLGVDRRACTALAVAADRFPRRLQHPGEVDRLAPRLGAARTPAARRRAGSRPGARAAGLPRPPPRSARGAPRSVSVGESSAVPAAMIEVSGVRRSCETERSSAVFSSSLRRSAPASIASASIRSRSAESSRSSRQHPLGLLAAAAPPRRPARAPSRPARCWRRRR